MHTLLLGSDSLAAPASTLAENTLEDNALSAPASTLAQVALSSSITLTECFDAGSWNLAPVAIKCFDMGNWHFAPVAMIQTAEEAGSTTSSAGATGWIG
jgi:hypothetical protein